MTVIAVVAVFSAILALAMAVDRSRSRRNSRAGGSYRRGHAPGCLAGGAVIGGDAGGGFGGGGGEGTAGAAAADSSGLRPFVVGPVADAAGSAVGRHLLARCHRAGRRAVAEG